MPLAAKAPACVVEAPARTKSKSKGKAQMANGKSKN